MFETYVWIYVQTTIIVLQFLIANELSQLHFQEFMINQMKNKIPSVSTFDLNQFVRAQFWCFGVSTNAAP